MTLPGWRAWLFSGKALMAASLALYVALWMDMSRPYWAVATVYIVAQPFAGTTLSKAIYRLAGTMLGGVGAVLLVPNLSNSPELLTLAMALWTGVFLFLSLLDRRPHGYIFMLAGYTTAIIGFPAVDDPGGIFITAVARVQEIGLGIICTSLVGALVLPQPVGPAFEAKVEAWLDQARQMALAGFRPPEGEPDGMAGAGQARLAAAAIDIDLLAAHLGFDPSSSHRARRWAEMLRSRLLLMLPLTSSIAHRLQALDVAALPPAAAGAVAAVRDWLERGTPLAEAAALGATIKAARDAQDWSGMADWQGLMTANLLVRLHELVDITGDCRILSRHIGGAPGQPRLALPDIEGARGANARHADLGIALRSSAAAILAMLVGSVLWIATGWSDGANLPVMSAVVCSFFATMDSPLRPQATFTKWTAVAMVTGAVYAFALLPLAQDFVTLILLLAPFLLVAGLLGSNPATGLIGLTIAVNTISLLGLQGRYANEFASFANGGLATVAGLWLGTVITSVARVLQPQWVARRLARATWLALARAARQRGRGDRAVFASLLLDRTGQMATRVPTDQAGMMAAIRIGLNIVDLRRARHGLSAAMNAVLDQVFAGLAGEFLARAGVRGREEGRLGLGTLDRALAAASALAPGAARDDVLMGLTGIRLGLFPDGAAYAALPAIPAAPVLEHAA